jgi:NADH-quinone oxidoreductase subunit N
MFNVAEREGATRVGSTGATAALSSSAASAAAGVSPMSAPDDVGHWQDASGTKESVIRAAAFVQDNVPNRLSAPLDRDDQIAALAPAREFIWRVLAFVAIITCTFGNLAAYGQTNIKRLLAYSTIAQAGYMIMPVPAAIVLAGYDPEAARAALASMAFYAGVYLFMNLGAFAIVALLRNTLHSEEIADYAGLIRRAPITVVCFSVILISLIGLPPLAGFAGKLLIFYSLVQAKLWTVLVVGGLNTAISLYYYLRVVKIMTIDPEPEQARPAEIAFIPGTYIVAVTVPVVLLGVAWNRLNELTLAASAHLF